VSLDDFKVEGNDLVEKSLIGSKPRRVFWLVIQGLLDGRGCFGHDQTPFMMNFQNIVYARG
jgi:hypothetical protein